MAERNERVEALVRGWVLREFRDDTTGHLSTCPLASLEEYDADDGSYGCDTGCEYVRVSATAVCPHGEREEWQHGEFGELSMVIEDLVAEEANRDHS